LEKIAFKMILKPGCKDRYVERHRALWPELQALLKAAGISDYTIFLDDETNTLFAVQQTTGAASSQDLRTHPVVQRWWAYMADLMETNPDLSPVSVPLEKVFHLA
jgi:L-rhamnose mutarotase